MPPPRRLLLLLAATTATVVVHSFLLPLPAPHSRPRVLPVLHAAASSPNPSSSPARARTIEEVGAASIALGRADFPPTADTQFPASVDYLLTMLVGIVEQPFLFTIDTTASVNLVTKEVAEAITAAAAAAAGPKKGFGTKGFGGSGKGSGKKDAKKGKKGKKQPQLEEEEEEDGLPKTEEINLDILLPSEPGGLHVFTRAVVSDAWGGVGAGCLGLPFLRSFGSLEVNLKTMQGRVESPKPSTVLSGIDELHKSEEAEVSKAWTVDFAPLTIKMDARTALEALEAGEEESDDEDSDEEEEGKEKVETERPEVWIVDVHLDGSEESIPAIVDLGCQSSILNWRAARALGYRRTKDKDGGGRVVTPASAGEENSVGADEDGTGGIEVFFAEDTKLSVGNKIEVPPRRLAIADLPVFAYAGLGGAPAMVLGLDVLGSAGDRLVLDWANRRLTLEGPLLPIKLGRATLELPLLKCESTKVPSDATSAPFGVPWQYGVPAVLGTTDQEALLMIDTAAGGTVLRKESWEEYARTLLSTTKKEPRVIKEIDLTGTGAADGIKATQVALEMYLGGTVVREGHMMVTEAAVLGEGQWSSSENFDGILGQSFFGEYPLADFDFRHEMLRLYEKGEKEEEVELTGLLDYWPIPSSSSSSSSPVPARLVTGVSTELLGPNHFQAVYVILDGKKDTPILGLLDTGGQTSVLNWAAAHALGITDEEGKEVLGKGKPRLQSSKIVALGLDGLPVNLQYVSFAEVAFQGMEEGKDLVLVPPHTGGKNLAVAGLPGLERLGLQDMPAMIVGLDLLDGDRKGRLVLDGMGGRLFLA